MFEIGTIIVTCFNALKDSSLVRVALYKLMLISFGVFVLPFIFIYSFLLLKRFLLPLIWGIIEPLLNSVAGGNYALQITGFGGWIINQLNVLEAFTVIISAITTAFIVSFIKGR